jgi:hypothetical protein
LGDFGGARFACIHCLILHMGVYVKEKNSTFTKTPKKITPYFYVKIF